MNLQGALKTFLIRYTLLQVFSKFGKVTKLDFLFHKTGLLKGKPRGYAFVEYGNKDVSSFYTTSLRLPIRAMMLTFFAILVGGRSQSFDNHERLLRGRKLIVTFAHQAPLDQYNGSGVSSKNKKTMMDIGRPTTLSMLKTGLSTRHEG